MEYETTFFDKRISFFYRSFTKFKNFSTLPLIYFPFFISTKCNVQILPKKKTGAAKLPFLQRLFLCSLYLRLTKPDFSVYIKV